MTSSSSGRYAIRNAGAHWVITYTAMAGPCELFVVCESAGEADLLASLAFVETRRIEHKFSRYRDDNVVHAINAGGGTAVVVDEETARLLRYAGQCYELSESRFDITSGCLRGAWNFNGGDVTPDADLIASLLERVGWDKVVVEGSTVRLAPGMEIDLGGIGKEYAADSVASLLAEEATGPVLVNFGGDIRVSGHATARRAWTIGIEEPGGDGTAVGQLELSEGAVATSGDARRYCMVDGTRMGHILDPRTGWPVAGAPRSVTVVAETCTAAGFMATMGMLNGSDAEAFLDAQHVVYHCIR